VRRQINPTGEGDQHEWHVIADDGPPHWGAHGHGVAPDQQNARADAQAFAGHLEQRAAKVKAPRARPTPRAKKATAARGKPA